MKIAEKANVRGLTHHRPCPLLLALALWASVFLCISACGDGSPMGPVEEIPALPRALSLNEQLLVQAGNDFAFRFLQEVHGEDPWENLFLAPLSASMALGMTMNGAAGATFDEMRSTLGFGTMSRDEINQGYRDLMDLLTGLDPHVELGIGNSVWYRQDFSVRSDFLDRTRSYFDAEVQGLDFSDPGAAGTINAWVNGQTQGKIEEIVESPISQGTVMFLINAIYFKGDWTVRFPKAKTRDENWWEPWSSAWPRSIPLMQVTDTFAYSETDQYQAVDLPYGGKAFSMTVLLPRLDTPMAELVAWLDSQRWAQLTQGLAPKEGTVYLPRFRMEWEKVLNGTLQAMGMEVPFNPGQADFSALSDDSQGLYISSVKQKSFVDVNEEGTEAAGVTSVEIGRSSASGPFTFRADRSFLFVIRERFSGTILFAGVYMQPPTT